MQPKIVTLTLNPAVDTSTSFDKLVAEQKTRCQNPRYDAGGGGINVSKAIQRLGGNSTAIFTSGGPFGELLQTLIAKESVDYQIVSIKEWTRESFVATETLTNAQYRFGMPGPTLTFEEGEECLQKIETLKPDFLVASGSLPLGLEEDFYGKVAFTAKKIGAKLVLDTSGNPLKLAADEGVYLLKPNIGELSKLVGVESLELNQVDDAARELISKGGCKIVVVSLGPSGALVVTDKICEHIPAPMVQKKSTVGAGDSMVGGMVWSLALGKTVQEMVRMGVACGSAATMNEGTQLFKKDDVEKLLTWINTYGSKYQIKDL